MCIYIYIHILGYILDIYISNNEGSSKIFQWPVGMLYSSEVQCLSALGVHALCISGELKTITFYQQIHN